MKMNKGFEFWTPDEAAECLSVGDALYRRLWELLDKIDEKDRMPLGGDGTNRTVEYPPEPGSYPKGTVGAIWHKLTEEEQAELNAALEKASKRSQLVKELHCCGITVRLNEDGMGGNVTSTLHEQPNPEVEGGSEADTNYDRYEAAVDALESVVLAHACAGIDIQAPAYVEGVETAIAAIAREFA